MYPEGVRVQGVCAHPPDPEAHLPPLPCGETNSCKNITLPQTLFAGGNKRTDQKVQRCAAVLCVVSQPDRLNVPWIFLHTITCTSLNVSIKLRVFLDISFATKSYLLLNPHTGTLHKYGNNATHIVDNKNAFQ